MRKSFILILFIILLGSTIGTEGISAQSLYGPPAPTSMLVGTVPAGHYWINEKGQMVNSSGVVQPTLKEAVRRQLAQHIASQYNRVITVGGDYPSSALFDYPIRIKMYNGIPEDEIVKETLKYSDFVANSNASTVEIDVDSKQYKIHIPAHNDVLPYSLAFINDINTVVEQAIVETAMGHSINLYSFFTEQQVYVSDLVDFTGDNGKIKANQRVSYSLDQLLNPLMGYVEGSKAKTAELTGANARKAVTRVDNENGTFLVAFSADYVNFVNNNTTDRTRYTVLDTTKVSTSTGIKRYNSTLLNKNFDLLHYVDSTLRIALPTRYQLEGRGSTSTYGMSDTEGYTVLESARLSITNNLLYKQKADGSYEEGVNYVTYDINYKDLVVSKMNYNGTNIGVVIPTKYKEAVFVGKGDNIYFTGREFKFKGKYKSAVNLNTENKDIFAIGTSSGDTAANLRMYAFAKDTKALDGASHTALESTPTTFELKTDFYVNKEGFGGFVIYINNQSIKDPSLMTWLGSSDAKSISGVKAEELLKYINGSSELEKPPTFSLDEWNRMQAIKEELDSDKGNILIFLVTLLATIFGILLIVFGTVLVLVYWIDYFNLFPSFLDLRLLPLFTGGRFEVNPEKVGFFDFNAEKVDDGKSYVFLGRVLIVALVSMLIGIFLLDVSWVIHFIGGIYHKVSKWLGGV